jgi:flagellar M-ring protein FliF
VIVSVDAVFIEQLTRVTTEEVLPARGTAADAVPTGVVVRERQNLRDGDGGASPAGSQTTTSETEYQVGKRTEQVTSPAGALRRLEVAAVIRRSMSDADVERVRQIVSATIGINRERGDVVTVEAIEPVAQAAAPVSTAENPEATATGKPEHILGGSAPARIVPQTAPVIWAAFVVALVILAAVFFWSRARRKAMRSRQLSRAERERLLLSLQTWLGEPESHSTGIQGARR